MLFEFQMFCNLLLNIPLQLIWMYDGSNECKLGNVYYLREKDTGKLQCPAISKRKDCGVGYISFVKNVTEFQDLRNQWISEIINLAMGQGWIPWQKQSFMS